MQRHKSAEKEARKNIRHNAANRQARSQLKKVLRTVTESKDSTAAVELLSKAYSALDKNAKSGIIHANKAANQKARLSKLVKKLAAPAAGNPLASSPRMEGYPHRNMFS